MINASLPADLVAKAYVPPGAGELAWKRVDLLEALHALVAAGRAILGGEIWLVEAEDKNWNGLIPSKNGDPPGATGGSSTSGERPDDSPMLVDDDDVNFERSGCGHRRERVESPPASMSKRTFELRLNHPDRSETCHGFGRARRVP